MVNATKKSVSKLLTGYRNLGLVKKVILGYIFVVFIPNIMFGLLFYEQYVNRIQNEYIEKKQKFIDESVHYLQYDLLRISGSYRLFQTNSSLVEYLSAYPNSEGEYVYSYLKNIRPLINYLYSSVPFISNIAIYKNYQKVFVIGNEIMDQSKLSGVLSDTSDIALARGVWKCTDSDVTTLPQYTFYQTVFDANFNKKLGTLAITANSQILNNFIMTLKPSAQDSTSVMLLTDNRKVLYRSPGGKIGLSQEEVQQYVPQQGGSFSRIVEFKNKSVILSVVPISNMNATLVMIEDIGVVFKNDYNHIALLIVLLVVLLVFLSILYYFISYTITLRVVGLAHHMKNVGKDNLTEYNRGDSSFDEIGMLISSYNSMIQRINDLVVTVHQEEIMLREAAYKALQAQIKPHFLYGTLETIRMLAETNNDSEVAHIAFSLGKLMRYALTMKNHVYLKNEIENAKNYLEIYKARMEDKLEYSIVNNDPSGTDGLPCPQFILQPLVENSLKHGVSKNEGGGIIRVTICNEEKYIEITVTDNGAGVAPDRLEYINSMLENKLDIQEFQMDTSGFALYNIKERIKSFFGPESQIVLQSSQGEGTTCIMKLAKSETGL